jgi:hypothetical protein
VLAVLALAFMLYPSTGDAYESCNGIGYFAVEVPSPGSMNPDGDDADWAWYPSDFVVGPDEMCNTLGGAMPTLDDFDIAIRLGWTPEPDNRFYALITVTDDTLNLDETNVDNFWNDDDAEIIMDANHGSWAEANNAIRVDHQQIGLHIPGEGRPENVASIRFQQPPEMQWPINEGMIEASVAVTPSPTHGATNTTSIYEARMWLFDQLQPDGEAASVRHVLAANQVLGCSVTYNDADTAGRTHQLSTHVNELGAHESEFTAEVTLLPGGATVVEARSWGAVKALF